MSVNRPRGPSGLLKPGDMTGNTVRRIARRIADHLVVLRPARLVRVAVDGIECDVKSALANEVEAAVRARGRTTIRLAIDEFRSPDRVEPDEAAVLIVEGILQLGESRDVWDEVIFVDTSHVGSDAYPKYPGEVDPAALAGIVISNNDPERLGLRRIGGREGDSVRLFSYGTLQQGNVQISTFGRLLDGTADVLPGYRTTWVAITDPDVLATSGSDRHPIVSHTGDPGDSVTGTVFTLSTSELAAADEYEVDDYRRVLARLGSGIECWVYVAGPVNDDLGGSISTPS
jgi:hypothetical protein